MTDERDDLLGDYDDMVEDEKMSVKRYKYFKKSGDMEKANEAAKKVNYYNTILKRSHERTGNVVVAEKRAYDRASGNPNAVKYFEGTKTFEIVKVREALFELERQRQRMID